VKTISRNRARLKRQGYRKNKGSTTDKGNKRRQDEDKTEDWLPERKNIKGLRWACPLYRRIHDAG